MEANIQTQCIQTSHQDFCKVALSHSLIPLMVAKMTAQLMWEHAGPSLLRRVRADQSEQTWVFGSEALKRRELKQSLQTETLKQVNIF